jgi:D-3-phosphoglycerate dehydrogenase
MKKKVLVTREVFDEILDFLSGHFEVTSNQEDRMLTKEELADRLADRDGALISITDQIDDQLLDRCPQLKAVSNMAVGFNNIDLAACTSHGVMATNTPGVLDDTTADLAWALILASSRRISEAEKYLRDGKWDKWRLKQFLGLDVHGATLGIIGMGRIGQAVARRAAGFEMEILYHNQHRLPAEIETSLRARYATKEELFREADIITVHVPYNPETHHLIGPGEFSLMKKTAIVINTSRGGVVDEEALIRALREGRIAGAGLDVFEDEPAVKKEFLKMENIVMTPHIGSSTARTRLKMAMTAADNLVAALTTGNPPNLLNPNVMG